MKKQLITLGFLICLFNLNTLEAQRRDDKAPNKKETTPATTNTPVEVPTTKVLGDIPEKWKDESAVVLEQKLTFAYYNSVSIWGNDIKNTVKETVYRRIKLMDKSSVSDFSEFYFYESEKDERKREKNAEKGIESNAMMITVIKPSGEKVKVNLSTAVDVDKDVPQYYRSYYVGRKIYKKVAIPNLNVGDIFEYQLTVDYKVSVNNYNAFHTFPSFYNTLASKYAILKQEYNFMLEEGFYLNLNSYNGAPAFKTLDYGYTFEGKKTEKMRTFQLKDENRDKLPNETFSLPYTEHPSVKLQVVAKLSGNQMLEGALFIGEKNSTKKKVTPEEVATRFNKDFRNARYTVSSGKYNVKDYAKKHGLKDMKFEEKVKFLYTYVKWCFFKDIHFSGYVSNADNSFTAYERAVTPIKDFYFAAFMSEFLYELDIKHEVIAVMPRNVGKIDNLLLGEEITWIVKAEEAGKSMYLYPLNLLQTTEVNREPYLYGAEGYAFFPSQSKEAGESAIARKVSIPAPNIQSNYYHTKAEASFDDQFEKATLKRNCEYRGVLKSSYILYACLGHDFISDFRDYINKTNLKEINKNVDNEKIKKSKKEQLRQQEEKDHLEKLFAKRKELMHEGLKEDYDDIVSYDSFRLINTGYFEENPTLSYEERFTLNNLWFYSV